MYVLITDTKESTSQTCIQMSDPSRTRLAVTTRIARKAAPEDTALGSQIFLKRTSIKPPKCILSASNPISTPHLKMSCVLTRTMTSPKMDCAFPARRSCQGPGNVRKSQKWYDVGLQDSQLPLQMTAVSRTRGTVLPVSPSNHLSIHTKQRWPIRNGVRLLERLSPFSSSAKALLNMSHT